MSTFDCLYSFNLCLMGRGCLLLKRSSDRKLRRCAATFSPFLERTFPGSIFFFAFAEVMAAMQDLEEENRSFWARHLNRKYHCQSLCRTSPSCWRHSHSLEALILGKDLTAPVTADCNCHRLHLQNWLLSPLSPRCWKDWAAGSSRLGLGEQLGAAVQNHMLSLDR